MRRWPSVVAAAAAVVAAGVVLVDPGWAGRVVQVYIAVLGVLTSAVLVGRARAAYAQLPGEIRSLSATRREPAGLPGLERSLRLVELGLGRGDDFEQFLRPELAAIASQLLLRQGVVAEAQPDRAAALLGPSLLQVMRPGRSLAAVPERGRNARELSDLFDRLEALV